MLGIRMHFKNRQGYRYNNVPLLKSHNVIHEMEKFVKMQGFMNRDDARAVDKIVQYDPCAEQLLVAAVWKNFIFENDNSCTASHMDHQHGVCCNYCKSYPLCHL